MICRILFTTLALASYHAMAQPVSGSGAPAASGTVAPATMAPVVSDMGSISPDIGSMTTSAPISGPMVSPTTPIPTTNAPVGGVPTASSPTGPRAPDTGVSYPGAPVTPPKAGAPSMAPSSATQHGVYTATFVAVLTGMWM